MDAELVISAVALRQYPAGDLPEIAFVGRSNVGKSSLINRLCNRKSLARTSNSPGKTATINFYKIENKLHFVDLPGYGYAKVSHDERNKWAKMINEYLDTRGQIRALCMLTDARHPPTKDDLMMFDWIKNSRFEFFIVATKSDKLSKTAAEENKKGIAETFDIAEDKIVLFSAKSGEGKDAVWKLIRNAIQ